MKDCDILYTLPLLKNGNKFLFYWQHEISRN